MTIYNWLCLFGIPAIIAALGKWIWSEMKKNRRDTESLKLGIQALLRSQMIADYNKYNDKGFAPMYARDNFENCYKQYHSLGANGVMDDLHEKFLDLPTSRKETKNEQ